MSEESLNIKEIFKEDYRLLSNGQFKKILNVIWKYHRFGGLSDTPIHPYVKYVSPQWDMRTGYIFCISFDNKVFDFRDSEKSMYECIMEWLNYTEPNNGGCWFCNHKNDEMVFDMEFDTYLHLGCLESELKNNPDNKEAQIMKYLLK